VGVESMRVGVADQCEQDRRFGVEPGDGLVFVRHISGQDARLRGGQPQRRPGRAEPLRGGHRRVQVVIENPVHGGAPLVGGVVPFGLVGRVGAEQVMEGEPGGQVLGR
jgi:hypothetical protein